MLGAVAVVVLGTVAAAHAQSTQPGLESLSDEKLMNELAARGLSSLLDRAFEVNQVPQGEREARRTMIALRQLADGTSRLSPPEQQALIARIVSGIDAALPNLKDPESMMQQAKALIDAGATRHVDTLELWGDSFAARRALRPLAQTIVALYDRASTAAEQLVETLGNQPTVDERRLDRMYNLQQLARFNARMSDYMLALALDPSDPRRAEVAQRGIDYLTALDTPDQPIRIPVRLRLGKLQLLRGNFDAARKMFDETAGDETLRPRPTPLEEYQARYFRIATDLAARDPQAALKQASELSNWQVINLAESTAERASADAATAMLQYRVHELEAQVARTPADKQKANDAAVAVLSQLLQNRPDLAPIINELLVARLPDDADLSALDPLLLQALVRQGEQQRLRPANEKADERTLRRAIAAANELISRGGIDATLLDNCRFVLPFLYQRLGEPLEAAQAFLAYAQTAGKNERGVIALDNAQAIVAALRKDRADEDAVRQVYETFLRVALDNFGRTEFAFEQARRLQLLGNAADAIKYYRLVPAGDTRSLTATFLLMLAVKQQLDELSPADPQRAGLLAEIQRLADAVNQRAASTQSTAGAASMRVRTKLLAAELARTELKDPQRAITLLSDIEVALQSLPNGDALLPEALLIRVQSYMALGRSSDATAALVQLLGKREGGQGAAIVYSLLEKLNDELAAARVAGDQQRMRTIARNRAELSGFLVRWARDSTDANIQKFTYRYMVFDAASKHLAADMEDHPAARKAAREAALALYRSLQSPENFALYRGTLDARAAAAEYDPAVSFGIAMLCYDLKQYAEARDRLARLMHDRRLGSAVITVEEGDLAREVDNEQYWEAVLKFLRANLALNENREQCQSYLAAQYIRWGSRVGGKRWKAQLEELRAELIPDFKPTTGPTT